MTTPEFHTKTEELRSLGIDVLGLLEYLDKYGADLTRYESAFEVLRRHAVESELYSGTSDQDAAERVEMADHE